MNHLVINGFICKESGEHFQPGSFFESENFQRIKGLESKGIIIANENANSLEVKEETKTKQPVKKASEKVVRKNKESAKDKS